MDKKKKIRYLSIKQDKLEKKLIAEIERYAPNRPKVPRETQNPYQYLSTFNNLIGYFREKPRPYGPLFTWAQSHQSFTKIGIPSEFEKEYTEGAKKVSTKDKQRKLEEERMNKNYNTEFFEDIDFTTVNNVFDLLNNQHLITKLTKTEEGSPPITHEEKFKLKYSESHKLSGDTQNSQFLGKSRKNDKKMAKTMMRVSTEPQNTPTTHKTLSSGLFKKKNRGKMLTLPNFPQNSISPTGKTEEDIPYLGEKVNKRINTDEVLNSIAITGDNQNSFQQKKIIKTNSDEQQHLNTTNLNLKKDEEENNFNKYQGIISHYGKQLLSSENYIKHRKLFNISKIQDQTLHNNNNNINNENNLNENTKKNKKIRIQTENDINDFYLNPFDLKNYSVNKILSNINEKSHDRFQGQISKMRETLKTHSAFLLKTRPRDYSSKTIDPSKREKTTTPANMTISSFSHQRGFPNAFKEVTL